MTGKGEDAKALAVAEEVTRKAPQRSYAHVVKANVHYRQNNKQAARSRAEESRLPNRRPPRTRRPWP
jgi:hypothetical protein